MQYVEVRELLKKFTVFSLNDIRKINPNFFRARLNEWQKKGYLKKIVRNYYIFSDLNLNESVLFEIANKIYNPSYISFEAALSYYNLIPESVYAVTSASTRKTYKFKTSIGDFIYRKIKSDLFFGYALVKCGDKVFKMADIEKTLLDYFYINPQIKTTDDFVELRINKDVFIKQTDEGKLLKYLGAFGQGALTKRIKLFLEFMKNA